MVNTEEFFETIKKITIESDSSFYLKVVCRDTENESRNENWRPHVWVNMPRLDSPEEIDLVIEAFQKAKAELAKAIKALETA